MIPFPLLGGNTAPPPPPIPEGVQSFTGTTYVGPDYDRWIWDPYTEEWQQQPADPEPPATDPIHYKIDAGNYISTTEKLMSWTGTTWKEVTESGTAYPNGMITTDAGVNIGLSVFKSWPAGTRYSGAGTPYSAQIFATEVLGRPDLMDLYILGPRTNYVASGSGVDMGRINVQLIATGLKRDRLWKSEINWVAQNDAGELWAQGINFRNQYGPWKSGTSASSQPYAKINPWGKIPDIPDPTKVVDVFAGAEFMIYYDSDGKFWSKGLNIGQFSDDAADNQVRTVWTEIPASRFPGFKKFFQSSKGSPGVTNLDCYNCVWYLTDTGIFHFGSKYAIADDSTLTTPNGSGVWPSFPVGKVHTRPLGLPQRADEPKFIHLSNSTGGGAATYYYPVAIWYEDPQEIYAMNPTGGWLYKDVDGNTPGLKFFMTSAPVGKTRSLLIDFNKDVTVVQAFDGKVYASGNPDQYNGMSSRTSPSTFTDQKIDSELFHQFQLSDFETGQTQVLLKDKSQFMIADATAGQNYFGNGTLWKPTVQIVYGTSSNRVTRFSNIGYRLYGPARNGGSFSTLNEPNYRRVGQVSPESRGLYANIVAGTGHIYVGGDSSSALLGGDNIGGFFGSASGWQTPTSSSTGYTENPPRRFEGTVTASVGTALACDRAGNHRIFGKNYWAAGQPVYPFSSSKPVEWTVGRPQMPYFGRYEAALLGYTDDEGRLDQPFFMYRGTDGLYYACGSNTTGCLGTGNPPASRDEQRWTFEPIKGSEIFAGKNVKSYCGHGNTSSLLFLCEGKVYGLGTPNRMKWDDQGTISNPFFPGFNRRLNEITYLMDMPDVMWTRPIENKK